MPRCLVVDDDDVLRERLARALRSRGLDVRTAADVDAAWERLADWACELAVVDLKMPGPTGLELVAQLREERPEMRCVVLTGYGSIANAVEAMRAGAVNYVTKPADADQVLAAFQRPSDGFADLQVEYQPPSLAEVEWEHIHRVLADCSGNITEAARLLDIPRRTLQRKLRKLPP